MLSGRFRLLSIAVLTVVAVLGAMLTSTFVTVPAAHASTSGTGGQFVVTSGRIISRQALAAGTWTTVQVAGLAGVPSDGSAGAVVLNATVSASGGVGQLQGRPDSSTGATLMVTYDSDGRGAASDTSTIAVGADGTIQVEANTAATLYLDVQGYYTSTGGGAGVAPGGFVPLAGTRIVDTRNGTGAAQATIPSGGSLTVQVGGKGGVSTSASAVAANILISNASSTAGYVTPYPTGGSKPAESLHYVAGAGVATSNTVQVALSSSGQITIANSGGTVNIVVDVQGYFAATTVGGSFTPASGGGLYDSRLSGKTTPSAGSTTVITADGVAGIPAVGHGVSAVALQLTAINAPNTAGYAEMWADGATKPPTTSLNFNGDDIRSNTVIVAVGSDGKIDLYTSSTTDYQVLVEGWYNALPTGPSVTNLTGSRSSATNLSFPIDDRTTAQVDVATGNLLLSTNALMMTGVTNPVSIGAAYNSRGWEAANNSAPDANKWSYALDGAGSLSNNASGVVYTGPDGSTWQYTATAGGAFTPPAGLQATLAQTSTDYTLTSWTSNQVIHFNLAGQPTSVVDRNGHSVPFTYKNYLLASLVTTAGPVTGRTASVAYSNGTTTVSQTDGTNTRSVSWTKDSTGNITSFTDATGKTTTFAYSGTDLTSVTAPEGGKTTFAYNSSDQVTEVDQPASAGTAATRLSYVSGTETQVASPNTDRSQSVASVPHTDYTLDASTHDVTKAVDPDGNTRSASYNPANNGVATATAGAGAGGSTTTNTYGANNKQSLTQVQSPTGGSSTASYSGSQANTAYLPQSTTSASGNTTSYTYDGSGNQMSSSTGGNANPSTATLTRESTNSALKGVVTSAKTPTGAVTNYSYDGNEQLQTVTPPAGTINPTSYTYDGYGRVATVKDGNGTTTTYTYDDDDRILSESFSDGTATVTDTYDGNGNELTSHSASGTITNTYDAVDRLLSTQNSAGGGAVTYTYDAAGNEITTADAEGTVTYTYDAANVLWSMTYPHGTGTETDRYKIDDHGRTDAYVNAGANAATTTNATNTQPTSFTGHTNTAYDALNRPSEVTGWTGQDTTKTFDTKYSYTTATGADSDQLQTATDTLTGKVTTYGYVDQAGNPTTHLTGVTQTGGTDDVDWAFTYDADGNRTGAHETGAATFDQTLTFNGANQITTTGYSYDGAGNLTASPGATYTYNGAEQMTSSTVNGATTQYAYAGASQSQLLSETTAGGPAYTYTYGRTDGTGVPEIDTETTGTGTTSRVLTDAVTGQALDLTDSTGDTAAFLVDGIGNQAGALTDTGTEAFTVTYDPYGAATVNSADATNPFWTQNPYGFKAGTRTSDAQNDLVKFGLRWYLTGIGSWTQQDTLDNPLDPANADRYAYAGSDPINAGDPAGQSVGSDLIDLGFEAFDSFGIIHNAADGDGEGVAKGVVGLLVGTVVGATCEGIITSASVGVGAVPGALICGGAGELAGRAVTDDWSL